MKVFRNLTIKNHDKKKEHWLDKTLQTSIKSFYFYCDDFVIKKFDLNYVIKV